MVNYPHLMFTGTYSEMVKEQRIKETEERQKDREEAEREGCGVQNKAVYIVVTSCIMVYGHCSPAASMGNGDTIFSGPRNLLCMVVKIISKHK